MTTNLILLVGSCVVPLVAIVVFTVLYFRRYKIYLIDKNSYANCQFLEDVWKGYIFSNLTFKKYRSGSKFWWYFFGEKYIDLVNYYSERCVYELDQLDRFDESNDNYPCFNRKAFMRHWKGIHYLLFDNGFYTNDYSSKNPQYSFNPRFGENPFGWMTIMIESKLFELYKKHTLQLLRTKGYYEFNKFLSFMIVQSQRYPHNAPFSIIASGKFHEKIMWDNSQEIAERIRHEVKVILGTNKKPRTESEIEKLQSLLKTSVLNGFYTGNYYLGLSEARAEIYELLEKVKVLT